MVSEAVLTAAWGTEGIPWFKYATAHSSKGLEFDRVEMCDDFHEFRIDLNDVRIPGGDEFGCLYVAATRARHELKLPDWLAHSLEKITLNSVGNLVEGDAPTPTPSPSETDSIAATPISEENPDPDVGSSIKQEPRIIPCAEPEGIVVKDEDEVKREIKSPASSQGSHHRRVSVQSSCTLREYIIVDEEGDEDEPPRRKVRVEA